MTPEDITQPGSMPLMGHLLELRRRLFICMILFVVASAVSYLFSETLLTVLAAPLLHAEGGPSRLIYTGLTEAFITFIKISCFSGAVISLPFIFSQVWLFIRPGLFNQERRVFWPFLLASPLLFFAGLAFAYFCVLPPAWSFFLAFQQQALQKGVTLGLEARVGEYVSLAMQILLAFSICFQLPVVLVLMGKFKLVSSKTLIKSRRYAFLGILITSAILTPPDVLSMIALACPLYALYELSIFFIKGFEGRQPIRNTDARYQMDS